MNILAQDRMSSLSRKILISALAACSVYIIFFLLFDRIIDLWVHKNLVDTWLFQAGKYVSATVSGNFIKLIITSGFIYAALTDPCIKKTSTRRIFYLCLSCAVAILIGEGLKYFFGRYRPIIFFEHGLYGMHFFSSEWALNSTPSGHTIRAFALFTGLSLLYYRFRILFMTAAVAIGVSRVIVTAHYPSDVIFGAVVGCCSSVWIYHCFFKDFSFHKGD